MTYANIETSGVSDVLLPDVLLATNTDSPFNLHMGLVATKSVFGGLRTTKVQTSLRIRADCSAPLLFAYWKVSYLNLLQTKC